LLDSYTTGRHLITPIRVSVAGPVNVGKSTLVNALLGFERAITSPVPGTTRDPVSAKTVIGGWPIILIDTAGTRDTADPIEQEGIARTQSVIADADLVLNVIDASVAEQNHVLHNALIPTEVPYIDVFNKTDIAPEKMASPEQGRRDSVFLSAKNGQGIDRLADAILHKTVRLDKTTSPDGCFLIFTERQYHQLSQAKTALKIGDTPTTLSHLETAMYEPF
jgi:small GTP-binding protein domain